MKDLDPRLTEMLDRYEVWQVMLRYARGLDRMDRVMMRSCYFDDAIDDHGIFVGTADAFIDWAMDHHRHTNTVHHHGLSNHYCEIDGQVARAETYFTFFGANVRAPHTLAFGRYLDRLEKRDGIWRIAGRICLTEAVVEVDDAAMPPAYRAALMSNGPATRDATDPSYARPLTPRPPQQVRQSS